jgi:hypothetical protein
MYKIRNKNTPYLDKKVEIRKKTQKTILILTCGGVGLKLGQDSRIIGGKQRQDKRWMPLKPQTHLVIPKVNSPTPRLQYDN